MARALLTAADFKETPIPQGAIAFQGGAYNQLFPGWEIADGSITAKGYQKPNYLTGQFVRGEATGAGVPTGTDGAATHAHSIPSHGHGSTDASTTQSYDYDTDWIGVGANPHTHTANASSGTLGAGSNDPLNAQPIPIVYTEAPGGVRGMLSVRDLAPSALPPRKLIFGWGHDPSTIPSGWALCNGQTVNGITTPDFRGKFIRGITATTDTIGAGGGSDTHTHDVAHTHGTGGPSQTDVCNVYSGSVGAKCDHTHTLTASSFQSGNGDNRPPYRDQHFICFVGYGNNAQADPRGRITDGDLSSSLMVQRGMVAVWGLNEALPTGYGHCDGSAWANGVPASYSGLHGGNKPNWLGRFIKYVSNSTTNGDGFGGNNQHSHIADGHTHTTGGPSAQHSNKGGDTCIAGPNHIHTSGGPTYSNLGPFTNLPAYLAVAFIVRD